MAAIWTFFKLLWDTDPPPPATPVTPSPPRTPRGGPPSPRIPGAPRPPRRFYTPPPEEVDYLDALRPIHHLRRTARLPDTPTYAHRAPERTIRKRRGGGKRKKAFRCPGCRCKITLTLDGHPTLLR
ncbi:hypothetical protein LTR86_006743 [Recurvomyces mirabilis]|nr:hypothetical protein LTR86_006743 [Recurvomyces mirabilis]